MKPAVLFCVMLTVAAQGMAQCQSAERSAAYKEYYDSRTKKTPNGTPDPVAQRQAYDVAKAYVEKYGEICPDQFSESTRKFITQYEEATDRFTLTQYVYGSTPDVVKAFETGKRILARTPDDLPTLLALAHAGDAALAAKNDALVSESLASAKKAVQEVEAGKNPAEWKPYKSRDEAVSFLYYYAGNLAVANRETDDGIALLMKAATFEGPAKTQPATYGRLAVAYHVGQLKPMQEDYNAKFAGKPETAEGKQAYNEVQRVMDRIIDAYARAVNLAGENPRYASAKPIWMESLQAFYKIRFGENMAGLDEYVAKAMTRPMPEP